MKRRLKKFISLLTVCVIVFTFSSCVFKGKRETPPKKAELVLQYIQEKNTDGIYDLLCERLQNQPDIKEEIEKTFEFMEGDVVSYEVGNTSSSSAQWSEDGRARITLFNDCNPIETSFGKVYQLTIKYHDENDYEPDLVGICLIAFVEKKPDHTGFSKRLEIGS